MLDWEHLVCFEHMVLSASAFLVLRVHFHREDGMASSGLVSFYIVHLVW